MSPFIYGSLAKKLKTLFKQLQRICSLWEKVAPPSPLPTLRRPVRFLLLCQTYAIWLYELCNNNGGEVGAVIVGHLFLQHWGSNTYWNVCGNDQCHRVIIASCNQQNRSVIRGAPMGISEFTIEERTGMQLNEIRQRLPFATLRKCRASLLISYEDKISI